MGDKRPYKPRKPGASRKPLKPGYDAAVILQEQMEAAVALYTNNSLQTIADTLSLNPIKVRKLLITAGVYESEIADALNASFEEKQGIPYKEVLEAVAAELNLSKASVTFYLPYKKGVYFKENCEKGQISVVAEGFRQIRQRKKTIEKLKRVMISSISGSALLLFKDTGSRRYPNCRFPMGSRLGGMGTVNRSSRR